VSKVILSYNISEPYVWCRSKDFHICITDIDSRTLQGTTLGWYLEACRYYQFARKFVSSLKLVEVGIRQTHGSDDTVSLVSFIKYGN